MRIPSLITFVFSVSLTGILTSCTPELRIHTDIVPPGSLRLAQVTAMARRSDVVQLKELHRAILSAGIDDAQIVDGSVAQARVHCCGDIGSDLTAENLNAIIVLIPRGVKVEAEDVVEVRTGRPPKGGDAGVPHTVTRKVARLSETEQGPCWWDPREGGRYWLRVLYCEGIEREGWVKQGGVRPAWFKPPAAEGQSGKAAVR